VQITIVTDAWAPQVNGVVRTLMTTVEQLMGLGHDVTVIEPSGMPSLPCPGYGEIRIARWPQRSVSQTLNQLKPEAIHIATEGPLGWAARRWCLTHNQPFTTSCHTRFPEYLRLRTPVPLSWSYAALKHFHRPAARTMVRSPSQWRDLAARGFDSLCLWPGAVDTQLFRPRAGASALWRQRLGAPMALYVGRIAREKSIEDFLLAPFDGRKVVVGDGPDKHALMARYPDVHFAGYRHGEALAEMVAAADVFVFPSKTDTLGLVMLEAMACGVPVAAYPVPGPLDVVLHQETGFLHHDLSVAMRQALNIDPVACRTFAMAHSWEAATECFASLLVTDEHGLTQTAA
jgi:glycosyltransferase involved in cell wall biosynthesis